MSPVRNDRETILFKGERNAPSRNHIIDLCRREALLEWAQQALIIIGCRDGRTRMLILAFVQLNRSNIP